MELIPVLRDAVRQFPYQEKLHAALMVALYRAGRQADALAVYRDLRTLLWTELGVAVSEELQQLHRDILDHHPRLGPSAWHPEASAGAGGGFRPAVPRTLPPDVPTFVGREKELGQIQELLTGGAASGAPVIVISGAAGVGKTALSVRAAHMVRDRYPDGQLFVDLRGFDRTAALEPGAVLGRFLRLLGLSGASVPGSLDEGQGGRTKEELRSRKAALHQEAGSVLRHAGRVTAE